MMSFSRTIAALVVFGVAGFFFADAADTKPKLKISRAQQKLIDLTQDKPRFISVWRSN